MVAGYNCARAAVLLTAMGWSLTARGQTETPRASNARESDKTIELSPRAAGVSPSAGQFHGPSERLLSDSSPTELTLTVPEDFKPRFSTNVGTIENVRELSTGQWGLQYRPPKERYPQVALIVAQSAQHYEPLLFRMELHGSPSIHFKSEPNIQVNVHVQGKVFGPVRTNGKGEGRIAVTVPPGVVTAETRGTDAHGNTNVAKIALDVPPFNRFLLICSDSPETTYLVSIDEQGRLSEEPSVELLASHGAMQPAHKLAPGLFAIRWEATPSDPSRAPLTLTARTGSSGGNSSQCRIAPAKLKPPARLSTPPPPAPSPTRPKDSWARLGLRLGLSTNGARVTGPWASIRFEATPFQKLRRLVLGVEVGALTSSNTSAVLDGESLDIRAVAIPALGRLGYELAWSRASLQATLGAGMVLSTVTVEGQSVAQRAQDLSALVGGSLAPGYELGPGRMAAEVGYWLSNFDDPNISGNILGLNATLGYTLLL